MEIKHFFHADTGTISYLVHHDGAAIVIDPVRDYDAASGATGWDSCREIEAYVREQSLTLEYALDTHVHADHLSGLPFFRDRLAAKTVTGAGIGQVQQHFKHVFNMGDDFQTDGSQFDVLISEHDSLTFGGLKVAPIETPGHTPSHMSWKIDDCVFLGDTLFAPDYGSARCDFPGGSAAALYESVQKIYALPNSTRLFLCHDYRPGGRELRVKTTVGEQKLNNVQIDAEVTKADYVAFREKKDAGLAAPKLILPSLQVNISAGALPEPEANDVRYLKIPLDVLGQRNG